MKTRYLLASASVFALGGCETMDDWFNPKTEESALVAPVEAETEEVDLATAPGRRCLRGWGFPPADHHGQPGRPEILRPGNGFVFRVQSCREHPLLPGGAETRSGMRHVLLGRGAGNRPEHQCDQQWQGRHVDGGPGSGLCRGAKAMALKDTASPAEQALIEALATRYSADFNAEREPQDIAWAEAMAAYVAAHPQDDDAAAIYAEAWMNTMPWDYWSADGGPRPETVRVIEALEKTIARAPDHPLALHLYIHAVEASDDPGRAEAAADRLIRLVPGSGHLVHMPAHIFWRVGRYDDAAAANILAAKVDEDYIAQCNAQGFYPALYYPHNIHFLWAAASMSGQSEVALEAARKVADNVRIEQVEQFPTVEFSGPFRCWRRSSSGSGMTFWRQRHRRQTGIIRRASGIMRAVLHWRGRATRCWQRPRRRNWPS